MTNENYFKQVELLLNVLPEVGKEKCFALHSGTAINLFVRNMPRLSVDIDLTYLPIEDRHSSLENILTGLSKIEERIHIIMPRVKTSTKSDTSKLLIDHKGTQVKIEVNQTNRGALNEPKKLTLCDKAQEKFEVFCEVPVIEEGQLFGGKI
ncbi:MAG: nucleotidyl transferase AbiEii/AbiGii toxin family protein [Bacteroidota bacterium]